MRRLAFILAFLVGISACQCVFTQSIAATQPFSVPASHPDTSLPFVAVFIDKATEDQLGPFPYDRLIYARAIRRLDDMGARAIVVKFFLDQAKSATGDHELASTFATSKARIILESRLDDTQPNPNEFPSRFALGVKWPDAIDVLSGESGWIPLPQFSAPASDIGFADVRSLDGVPVILKYRGKFVKSLFTCALEAAFNDTARIKPADSFSIAKHQVPITRGNEIEVNVPSDDPIPYLSFEDILNGNVADKDVRGRVVVLGFVGPESSTVRTKIGPVAVHRWFWHMLVSCYETLLLAPPVK